jgi:hypothetical protein
MICNDVLQCWGGHEMAADDGLARFCSSAADVVTAVVNAVADAPASFGVTITRTR